ncbi:hypothetical protein RFI_02004 [Reticulomyxa filosa]|uniref:Ferritin-like domain-containing protein n=1 Tax=Reticulomyxa filosa TaxID=46433 RepID=X6PA70_RETFI|nr:hypothetical protein RFI_02004 [Reticulomyxa filosa]|eukprot:ETO35071.1 hypothetical protein RFI_02004 [Reticulomyxa filosa]
MHMQMYTYTYIYIYVTHVYKIEVWVNYSQYYNDIGLDNLFSDYCVLRDPWSTLPNNVTTSQNGCLNEYSSYLAGLVFVDRTSLGYCTLYYYTANEMNKLNECANNSDKPKFENSTIELWALQYISDGRPFATKSSEKHLQASLSIPIEDHTTSNIAITDGVLSGQWLSAALSEHASIAAFNKVSLQLMVLGSPMDLLEAVQKAALDEWRHTQISLKYGSKYRGLTNDTLTIGAFPRHVLDMDANPDRIRDIAHETFIHGCVQETLGCLIIAKQCNNIANSESVDSALLEDILAIGKDEVAHAQLAWNILQWITQTFNLQNDTQHWMSTIRSRATMSAEIYLQNAQLLFGRNGVDPVLLKQNGMVDKNDVKFVLDYAIDNVFVPLSNAILTHQLQHGNDILMQSFQQIRNWKKNLYCVS